MNGLARASVRFRPASFAGTFIALFFASMVVTACGILLQTGVTGTAEPDRYAKVPVVVTASQYATMTVGGSPETEPLPDAARLPGSVAGKIAGQPGVRAAVPDLSFPVQSRDAPSLTGRNWAATQISQPVLLRGGPPGAGQVVLDAASARTGVGGTVALTTPQGTQDFRVAGLVRGEGQSVLFADDEAAALSGHPGQADAIAVFPRPGVRTAELERQVKAAAGRGAEVFTGTGRGMAEHRDLATARETLSGLGGSFGGIASTVAIFVVLGTVALAVGQRGREMALLRAIGATPRQIRRMIATEAMIVAPVAGAAGALPGIGLAAWWFDQLKERGAVPGEVTLSVGWIPILSAIGAGTLASLAGGWAASRRPARARPSQAMGEASTGRNRPPVIRTLLGLAALIGGLLLARVAATASGEDAAESALGVVMLCMVAVALLGPLVARISSALLGLPVRAAGAPGELAVASTRTNARRLASAITPIVLVVAFSGTMLITQSTIRHASDVHVRQGMIADQVITSSGDGLPADATRQAASVPGVEAAVGVTRTKVLWPGKDSFTSASAIGVSADPAKVLDLGVVRGSTAALKNGTVALDATLADTAKARVGRPIELRLGDGTNIRPTVIALYERGLGLGQVLLPRETIAGHLSAELDSEILVRNAPGAGKPAVRDALAGRLPFVSVTDRAGYAAQADEDMELNAWANNVMAAVLGGFAAIAAANTLVMTVLDRRREVALLRLAGTTRRQIMAMMRWEALLVTSAGLLIGGAIVGSTLTPFARGIGGGSPYVPPVTALLITAGVLALGLLSTSLPARALLRRPAEMSE